MSIVLVDTVALNLTFLADLRKHKYYCIAMLCGLTDYYVGHEEFSLELIYVG